MKHPTQFREVEKRSGYTLNTYGYGIARYFFTCGYRLGLKVAKERARTAELEEALLLAQLDGGIKSGD